MHPRFILLAFASLQLVACDSTAPAPDDLAGTWGASGAELVATSEVTTLELACLAGEFATPALDDGAFEMEVSLHSLSTTIEATARGRVSGPFLQLELELGTDPGRPYGFVLVRGRPGHFGGWYCADT